MSDEEERWHVRIAPGEIKLLTLEQIDDLFRLEMIDGDTLLRQEGTEDWLRLRVVAGLDEEEAAPAAPPPVAAAPSRSMPPPPPPVAAAPSRSMPPPPPPPMPAPSERAPFSPSPSFIPPAPSARGASAAPPPPPPAARPPGSPTASFAPPAASFASPAAPSFAPPAASFAPPARANRTEAILIGLAAVLGLLIALHRNGALAALFASAGQAAAYDGLEASLGGPGVGTPRAVEALVAKTSPAAAAAAAASGKR